MHDHGLQVALAEPIIGAAYGVTKHPGSYREATGGLQRSPRPVGSRFSVVLALKRDQRAVANGSNREKRLGFSLWELPRNSAKQTSAKRGCCVLYVAV